jgi:hypothetical protein
VLSLVLINYVVPAWILGNVALGAWLFLRPPRHIGAQALNRDAVDQEPF